MDDAGDDSPLTTDLRGINRCARALRKRRIEAGALTLASPEVRFELDKAGIQSNHVRAFIHL